MSEKTNLAEHEWRNMRLSHHVPALDGLRGCAVLMVLYYHECAHAFASARWNIPASLGWTGVDLFFVLSGYLITNILLSSRYAANYYKVFYLRRVLRIVPVYYLALIWIFLVEPTIYHHVYPGVARTHYSWSQQIWYWLNVSNLRSAFYPMEVPLAAAYWSLGIEEQFYAVWPTVVRRLNDKKILWVCGCGLILSIVVRCLPAVQHYQQTDGAFIVRLTPFRLDGLLMGALLAVFLRNRPSFKIVRRTTAVCFVSGVLLLLLANRGFTDLANADVTRYGYTGLALIFASLVSLCVAQTGKFSQLLGQALSSSVLRSFGRYSYFIYVFEAIFVGSLQGHVLTRVTRGMGQAEAAYTSALIATAVCFVAAAISWHVMEEPILRLKKHFRDHAPTKSRSA